MPECRGGAREAAREICRVETVEALTSDLFLLVLRPGAPVLAEAGQFAMLRPRGVAHHPLLARPMSILGDGDSLRFLVRRCGLGTGLLTSLRVGDEVDVLGPVGRGWGPAPAAREGALVLAGGGVGVAPLLFAARDLAGEGRPPILLYGARTASELVLLDVVESITRARFSTDDGSRGLAGPVTGLLASLLEGERVAQVWTCGPEPMMAAVAKLCAAAGVRCLASVEARMACGRGLCLGCAREDLDGTPRYVCKDGPVFDAAQLFR